MPMIFKKCFTCGVECWHNGKKDGTCRCTYCGTPPGGSQDKKAIAAAVINRQVARASLLKITRMGRG
jgi:hypothetical protein